MRVTPELEVLDTVYVCNHQIGGQNKPAVVFDGNNYVVAWHDPDTSKGIICNRVTPEGVVLDTECRCGSGDEHPDIAAGTDRCLVVWSKDFFGVCGRFLDQQGQPLDTVLRIAAINAVVAWPKVDFDGQNYLVVWSDFGSTGDMDVFGRLVTAQGQLPNDVFAIAQGTGIQNYAGLVFDGSRYIVVWSDNGNKIFGQIIGTDGRLVGAPFQLSDTTSKVRQFPAIGATNGNYLAVWAEYYDGFDIYGAVNNNIGVMEKGSGPKDAISLSITPNPFRTNTCISLGHRAEGSELKIFDATGSLIRSFILGADHHVLCWNGKDQTGQAVPAGMYFIRIADGPWMKIIKVK